MWPPKMNAGQAADVLKLVETIETRNISDCQGHLREINVQVYAPPLRKPAGLVENCIDAFGSEN